MSPRRTSLLLIALAVAGCTSEGPVGPRVGASSEALRGCDGTVCVDEAVAPNAPAIADGMHVGLLSEPSSAPVQDIASSWAAEQGLPPLRIERVQGAGNGHLVRLVQTHGDLDVIGGELVVRIDLEGRVRWASVHTVQVPTSLRTAPAIVAEDALRAAAGTRDEIALDVDAADHTRLVVAGGPGLANPRLAWHVVFEDEAARQTYRAYVDAQDATVLDREDLVRHAPQHRARVYDVSPTDSELEEVVFDALPTDATTLTDADFEVRNCIDERMCHELKTTMGTRNVHHCELVPTAFTEEDGSFLGHEPPSDHAEAEDSFAEVQVYHHMRSGLAAFRRWSGDPELGLRDRLTTVVNMRVADLSTPASECSEAGDTAAEDSELRIEENAYFWPRGGLGPTELGDRVVMHQTARADWAYDGEIVWHELTHAMMNTTTPLAWRVPDELGVRFESGGLHEGFSDYFAAAITNRAQTSYYSGDGGQPLGDLERPARCGDVMTGEEHDESAPWAGALWAIRRSLRSQTKREMFDAAMFTVISSLGQFDGFERAVELVLAELELGAEELADREGLDSDARAFLAQQVAGAQSIFAERDLPGCNGRTLDVEPGDTKESLQLLGPRAFGWERYQGQPIPASMQFRLVLEYEAEAIHVFVDEWARYDETYVSDGIAEKPEAQILIKEADDAIRWRWELPRGEHDADRDVALRFAPDGTGAAVAVGPFEPGVYYVQITNTGASANLYGVTIDAGDAELPADAVAPVAETTGGGCSAAFPRLKRPADTSDASWLLLVALLVLRRRR